MIRRLVRHGPSTLIVSLPAGWVKQKGLHEKDEVEVLEEENRIVVCPKGNKRKEAVVVDITPLDRTSIVLLLHAIYRAGFSKATLQFRQQYTTHYRTGERIAFSKLIHGLMNRFIGYEISKETENSIEITQVSYIDKEEIEAMLNRTFILLKEMVDSFCKAVLEQDYPELEKIEDKHDSTTRVISYLLRAINRGEYTKPGYALSHILASTDKIIDILKYAARERVHHQKALNKQMHPLLEIVVHSFADYLKLLRKYDESIIVSLSGNRDQYKHAFARIKSHLGLEDIELGTMMTQTLELLFDLVEWRMYLHLKKEL